ncbi:MAG: hypothetical protein CVV44_21935 [Spirochaetae bacterium HGW-Spirochaetae-1]|jgi:predicted secreted protein|nr:MAG: hypothetical protein CVV44_21935 [Spirochaetae bacterium HGW-Spirochaetae-1]
MTAKGKKMVLAGMLVVAAGLFSCSPRAALILTDESNGKSFRIEKGKILEVRLSAQMGTGYSWKWKMNDEFFTEEREQDIITAEKNKTGDVDIQVFRLRPLVSGETELEFILDRAWEKDKAPQKEFSVRVVIY